MANHWSVESRKFHGYPPGVLASPKIGTIDFQDTKGPARPAQDGSSHVPGRRERADAAVGVARRDGLRHLYAGAARARTPRVRPRREVRGRRRHCGGVRAAGDVNLSELAGTGGGARRARAAAGGGALAFAAPHGPSHAQRHRAPRRCRLRIARSDGNGGGRRFVVARRARADRHGAGARARGDARRARPRQPPLDPRHRREGRRLDGDAPRVHLGPRVRATKGQGASPGCADSQPAAVLRARARAASQPQPGEPTARRALRAPASSGTQASVEHARTHAGTRALCERECRRERRARPGGPARRPSNSRAALPHPAPRRPPPRAPSRLALRPRS